jgi:hypothetical protein
MKLHFDESRTFLWHVLLMHCIISCNVCS